MKLIPWREQIAEGRVFQLRSKSTRYPPPCVLIVRKDETYRVRHVVEVDRAGVCSWPMRRGQHRICVENLRIEDLPKRIARRRLDLERFDRDDLALIRYGGAIDFDGKITMHHYSDLGGIPLTAIGHWTLFWVPAYDQDDFVWTSDEVRVLLRGAWHMEGHGGPRHLGYKYGHAWATRHVGARLKEIRRCLQRWRGDVIEQDVLIARWNEGDKVVISQINRECPPLGQGMTSTRSVEDWKDWDIQI